jgi:hypothetical protein
VSVAGSDTYLIPSTSDFVDLPRPAAELLLGNKYESELLLIQLDWDRKKFGLHKLLVDDG